MFPAKFCCVPCSAAVRDDPPDSFYEFTADDYARVARGWGANTAGGQPASGPLKTAKLRAAEAAAAAQRVGPIPVRVMFPDGMVLQVMCRIDISATPALWQMVSRLHCWSASVDADHRPEFRSFRFRSKLYPRAGRFAEQDLGTLPQWC